LKPAVSGESFAEYTLDYGDTWHPLAGYRVLADRLGIRIDQPNLADIFLPDADDPITGNFFAMLADLQTQADVWVRLTCCVSAPHRNIAHPDRRITAGTVFAQAAFHDRGPYAQRRTVVDGSRFAGGQYAADLVSVEEAEELIDSAAEAIQDAAEDRLIEGSLPIEWPDEPLYLGDRISRIAGLEVPLGVNTGPARRYPRIVGRTLLLTPQTYSMTLLLDTYRKAAVI
jgi:hypothetical protein